MPRNISFAMTTEQIRMKTKTVTRRLGWWRLTPGTILQPVEKGMGLKRGEKVVKVGGPIRVVSVRRERLKEVTQEDVNREGFPYMSREDFILFFLVGHRCPYIEYTPVNRIEFEYL